jgi:hypothetical protein
MKRRYHTAMISPMRIHGGIIMTPDTNIYFGARTSQEDIDKVIRILKYNYPANYNNIQICFGYTDNQDYKIKFMDWTTFG